MADMTPCEKAPSTGPLLTKKEGQKWGCFGEVVFCGGLFADVQIAMSSQVVAKEGCCCIVDAIYMYFTAIQ